MISTFPSITPNALDEITIIGGTSMSLYFTATSNGSILPLIQHNYRWSLAPIFQENYEIANISGSCTGAVIAIQIGSDVTKNLVGKYIQQATLIGAPTYLEYKLGRGIINILPRIGLEQYE